ncbi:MAG TPA: beta-L-arabinofuranosidase domain-containing protein [Candidatus Limnocylindrales bacterium]
MAVSTTRAGPVHPSPGAIGTLRPLALGDAAITGGFWAERLRRNRERTIPHGFAQLDRAGNFHDLRLAAGASGSYQALGLMFGAPFPFLDSDVYKWLEAAGWELGRAESDELRSQADLAIELVAKAQRPDGYLNTFVQVLAPGTEYRDLKWGHELYCVGHLIQAAVAWKRALGDDRLLEIASHAAAHAEAALGPGAREAVDGHPEIEMALVELYRTTGERRHLETAASFLDRRGHGLLGSDRFGAAYWQDHATVRDARTVAGHAVRQLYLDCGAVDVATELGDDELLASVRHRWDDLVATRMYLTGGVGSRHRDESFGDPYELPPDQAYTETCAAIASVMLAWRLLLATGDPRAADLIERTILNGVLSGLGQDGTSFFYVNPLQRRTVRAAADPHAGERQTWYPCACCPPNLMRTLASWEQLLATTDAGGVQVQQYADATIRADVAGGEVRLATGTAWPWDGRVVVEVVETPDAPWTLTLRRPAWATDATITWPGGDATPVPAGEASPSRSATWQAGDRVVLETGMGPRLTAPHPRIDALRDTLAIERGPLVYCLETADLPADVVLEDIRIAPDTTLADEDRSELAGGVVGVSAAGVARPAGQGLDPAATPVRLRAIPYHLWANREPAGMRVWIPRDRGATGEGG